MHSKDQAIATLGKFSILPLPPIIQNIHFVQLPIVNMPYIGTALERVKKFHTESITANDSIHFLLLLLDKEYRQKMIDKMCSHIMLNDKLKPALKEIQKEYGYKISDIADIMFEQSSLF